MIRAGVAAVFLAGSALVAPAAAQTVSETARRFGALESVQHISLSPSGSQVAFIRPVENGRTRLFIANLAGDGAPRAVFQTGDPREKLYRCKWATEAQLVCSVQVVGEREGDIVGYTRQLVVSSDGKTVSSLSARTDSSQFYAMYDGGSVIDWDLPGKPGRVLMERQFVPRQTVGSNIKHEEEGLGVEEVDLATLQRRVVVGVRDELAGIRMGEMRPVTFPAADGTMIPGYLTLPPGSSGKGLPAIVMPHGGPSARDEWGFDWLVQYFVARGFVVLQPNYRGSSGYGSAWYQKNGFQSWRTAIGDVNDAGRWLLGQGIAAPGKLSIVGWSYGGYAALQSQVLAPDLFGAVVAIAPVTDLGKLRQDSVNRQSYRLVDAFIGEGPHVKEGSPALNARSFKAPVLMFHGTYDQNVSVDQARLMEQRLRDAGKAVTYVEFPALAHSLENSEARARVLAESDAFLRKALGLPQD